MRLLYTFELILLMLLLPPHAQIHPPCLEIGFICCCVIGMYLKLTDVVQKEKNLIN